jgi:hypothetical protein
MSTNAVEPIKINCPVDILPYTAGPVNNDAYIWLFYSIYSSALYIWDRGYYVYYGNLYAYTVRKINIGNEAILYVYKYNQHPNL